MGTELLNVFVEYDGKTARWRETNARENLQQLTGLIVGNPGSTMDTFTADCRWINMEENDPPVETLGTESDLFESTVRSLFQFYKQQCDCYGLFIYE